MDGQSVTQFTARAGDEILFSQYNEFPKLLIRQCIAIEASTYHQGLWQPCDRRWHSDSPR